MSQQTVRLGDWVVITLDGEIDLARVDDLAQIVTSKWNPTKNLLIDFSAVTFVDSTGIGWLFRTDAMVTKVGREMRLIIPEGGQIERLLELVGAKQVFPIYRNLDKAFERISKGEISLIMDGQYQRQFGPSDG